LFHGLEDAVVSRQGDGDGELLLAEGARDIQCDLFIEFVIQQALENFLHMLQRHQMALQNGLQIQTMRRVSSDFQAHRFGCPDDGFELFAIQTIINFDEIITRFLILFQYLLDAMRSGEIFVEGALHAFLAIQGRGGGDHLTPRKDAGANLLSPTEVHWESHHVAHHGDAIPEVGSKIGAIEYVGVTVDECGHQIGAVAVDFECRFVRRCCRGIIDGGDAVSFHLHDLVGYHRWAIQRHEMHIADPAAFVAGSHGGFMWGILAACPDQQECQDAQKDQSAQSQFQSQQRPPFQAMVFKFRCRGLFRMRCHAFNLAFFRWDCRPEW